ncbi:MAG: efflux RND transporter permease subunit [Gammaproteobacteria bacterium]|nr:efflux RND transporter permease subunit [Gammaproteobacteria bacterium]
MLWLRCEISHSIFGPEQSISFQERNVTAGEFRGPIAYMAANPVAANLLMGFLLVVGLISAVGLPQEFLPEASLDRIQVVVPYPGAAPSEVEELIVRKIEEQIQSVEGVKRIESSAAEGLGSVIAEFRQGTDMNRALADMKAQVDSILTFPAGAERPEVREITSRQSIFRLVVYGAVSERTIKELTSRIEDGILALPEVSFAESSGVRDYEISIEVPRDRLRALGLTLEDVALAVRLGSLELSAGKISTGEEEIRIRTLGQNYGQFDFEDIVVMTGPNGAAVRLGEIATVHDAFADSDLSTRFNGQPAARINVFRTAGEDVLDIAQAVRDYIDTEVTPFLPEGVAVSIWQDDSVDLRGRVNLLIENAALGLFLVFLALGLFLQIRLAMWVALGLAVSFTGTFVVMQVLGVSISMFSLMAMVLALGIVVDDAIVVGENIYAEREKGAEGLAAAVQGTQRIAGPVIFSILTTVTAFSVLLTVPGPIGRIGLSIPIVVIAVLMLSLVESLLVLPNHLAHLPKPGEPGTGLGRAVRRTQASVDASVKRFIDGPLDRALRFATAAPSVVLAATLSLMLLSVTIVVTGMVRYEFLPQIEGDIVSANIEMPVGTPSDRTSDVALQLEAAGQRVLQALSGGAEPISADVSVTVGQTAQLFDPLGGNAVKLPRGHIGTVEFRLPPSDFRDFSSTDFQNLWREEAGEFPGVRSLAFSAGALGLGLPVHLELSHPDPERLALIADEVAANLESTSGVFDVSTNHDEGVQELQIELKPAGRSLDVTLDDFARQVRAAFFGTEALRVQRGREEMRVFVRLPETERNSPADIENYAVRTPHGGVLPLGQIADVALARSPTTIHRLDERRVITVTANVDSAVITGQQVNGNLQRNLLAGLSAEYPDFLYFYGGEQRQQQEVYETLPMTVFFAFLVMYALMAIPFGSYTQPLIVMTAIPLGLVGALIGHILLDLSLGFTSLQGIIGVSGVVVNDSLMMIKFINNARERGLDPRDAIIVGAKARFRAILLTSITTFLGVAPLMFEQSIQTQHLVPLAASVGFGVVVATALLMLVVPALVMLQYNLVSVLKTRTA